MYDPLFSHNFTNVKILNSIKKGEKKNFQTNLLLPIDIV